MRAGKRSLHVVWATLLLAASLGAWAAHHPSVARSDPPGSAFRFVHDEDGRLQAAIDPEGDTAVYDWDAAGNLLSISRHDSAELSLLRLSPPRGDVGTAVTIEGTGFSATPASNTVKFNGVAATVEAATPWSLSVKVPAGATSGPVTVSSGEEGPVSHGFTVAGASKPSVSSLTPTVADEGEEVTVSGSNFAASLPDNIVTLNSLRPTVLSASSSLLEFEVPFDRLGGKIAVTTPEGTVVGPDLYVPPGALAPANVGATGRFSLGDSKTVEFEAGSKVALFLFDGEAGEAASLSLSGATRSGSATIWSPSDSQVAGGSVKFAKGGSALVGPATLPETGTYTVAVGGEELGAGTVNMTSYGFQHVTGLIVPSLEGAQQPVSLTYPGQEARYTIAGTAGQGASLKTTSSAIGGNYDIKWLNPAGQVIKSWTHSGSQNSFHETVAFPTTGTYTLVVDPSSTHTGTVDLTVWDGIHDAGTITPSAEGEAKTLPLEVPGGMTKATFSGSVGERVLVDFSSITFNGFVGIHTPKGSAFSGSEGSLPKGGNRVLEMTLPETGTYTVWLIQGASTGETGSVKATAYAPPADIAETIAPSEEGAQKTPSISAPGQNARYSVSATAGQAASLKTTSSAISGSYRLEWLNPAGQVIKSWTHSGSQNTLREAVAFPTTGTYTLVVNPEGTATGSVTLTVYDASVYDAGTISPSAEGASKTLPLKVPAGTTKATFAGTAGQKVLFHFTEITFAAYVGIHNPKGNAFSGSEGSLPKGGNRVLEMTLPETGTYNVWLIPTGSEIGSAKATAYAPPADISETLVPSEEGAQKTPSISSPGQDARYSVEVEAGDAVSVKTSSSSFTGNYSVEWLNPSGGLVSKTTWNGTASGFWSRREFTTAGTYTLVVNPDGVTTGAVTLTAWDAPVYDAGTVTPTTEGESKVLQLKAPGSATKATFAGTAGQKLKFEFTEITFPAYVGI
ncbi:MAG TPA: IPT/TIG domain-containing protein, partial [Solirubrobacterales bacterium]